MEYIKLRLDSLSCCLDEIDYELEKFIDSIDKFYFQCTDNDKTLYTVDDVYTVDDYLRDVFVLCDVLNNIRK